MLKTEKGSSLATGLVWCPKSFDLNQQMDHIATELAVQGGIVCEEMSNDDIMKRPTKFSLNEFTWAF